MTDKLEAVIKDIAARHGIALGRDDPILMLQTINAHLLRDGAAAQEAALGHFKAELESIAHRWGDEARNKAERTLNAALDASRHAMAQGMQEGGDAAAKAVASQLDGLAARLAGPLRDARRVAVMNMIAGGMTVFAAALVLAATL